MQSVIPGGRPNTRIGFGYDIHRLEPVPPKGQGRPFILGGVLIDREIGPVATTDGDTLLHAITDGMLGALALPAMGQMFPPDDSRKGTFDSAIYLAEACRQIGEQGWKVGNIDASIILERPRIREHLAKIKSNVARLLATDEAQLSIKAKTHEGLGDLGAGKGVAVHVSLLLFHLGHSQ